MGNTERDEYVEVEKKSSPFGYRHLQCLLLFSCTFVSYALRVNLSIAIVVMTDKNATSTNTPAFSWNEKTVSVIMSSFFWGYTITQIPAGYFARKYGGKVMILISVLANGIIALSTPFCVTIGNWQVLCALRVLQGLMQGMMYPAAHTILSKWSPVEERGTMGTFSYIGTQFGIVTMLACSGYLASTFGWPSIFYIPGVASLAWVVAWILWGASSPAECKLISIEERSMIERSLNQNSKEEAHKAAMKVPWMKILTSVPVLALVAAHCTAAWGYWTLLTQISIYMKNALGKDIQSNAIFSAMPYLACCLMSFVFVSLSHFLSSRKLIGLSTSRKLFNSIGTWGPATTLFAVGYVTKEHSEVAIILLVLTMAVCSAEFLGNAINHIDLSPNFAGILVGFSKTAGNIMSVIAPLVVGFVVTDTKDINQWRIVFTIAGGFFFIGNLIFLIFGTAEVQPWNDPTQSPQEAKLLNVKVNSAELKNCM